MTGKHSSRLRLRAPSEVSLRLTIRLKLLGGFAAVVALALVISGVSWLEASAQEARTSDLIERRFAARTVAAAIPLWVRSADDDGACYPPAAGADCRAVTSAIIPLKCASTSRSKSACIPYTSVNSANA